jgi:hypothetical protein
LRLRSRFKVRNIVLVSPGLDPSDGDKALGPSEWLLGSLRRMGRVDQGLLSKEQIGKSRPSPPSPPLSEDLVSLVRHGLEPGAPGRPLEEISWPFWKISPASGASN